MIPALFLLIAGYDLAYYAINVLVWAHFRELDNDPVPLRYCIGIPFGDSPGGAKFVPPFQIGTDLPQLEGVTPRQLLGGEPWTTLLASAYDTSAGSIPGTALPGTPGADGDARTDPPGFDPNRDSILPRLPGEGVYGGLPGHPGVVNGLPGEFL